MSIEDQFNVYITGEAIDGYDLAGAQLSFAEKFKLTTEKVDKVFQSPMPFTIKKSIDSKTANAYLKAIHLMGLDAYIEPVPAPNVSVDTMALVSQEDHQKHLDAAPQVIASKSYDSVIEAKETSGVALEVLYDAPDSALSEEGDDDVSIGGWLRFFQVTNVLSLALTMLLFLAGAILTVMEGLDREGLIVVLVDFLGSLPVVVFCVLILRILSDRSEDVPRRISTYLNFKFLATIGVFWILTVSYYSEFQQPKEVVFGRNMGMVLTMLYCWIWMFYFKRSKRVKEYYNVNHQKDVRADQTDGSSVNAYNTQDEVLALNKGEREFKIPLSAPISALIVILVYAGHAVATSTGNEGVFESLKPISFHVFLLCELALIFLIVYSKKQLDGFLTLYPVIRDRDALVMLKPVLKANSYSAMFVMFFLGLGALASIVTIANAQGSEGVIVSGLCLLAMGFMAWYNPSEQKVKQLRCTDESLEGELITILNKWGGKVVSKS